jgi:hypothetical protein
MRYISRNRRTQPRPKPALGKAKPVPSTSHTRILLPSDRASQSPGSFKWILPKRFPSTGRTHSSGLPSYPHAPVHRCFPYNTNPLYNKRSFPSCNFKFPTNVMFLVTKYFPERCVLNVALKQLAWFTQIKTATIMCSFVHSDLLRLFKSHGTIKFFEINL